MKPYYKIQADKRRGLKMYQLTCDKCGMPFESHEYRAKWCQECRDYRGRHKLNVSGSELYAGSPCWRCRYWDICQERQRQVGPDREAVPLPCAPGASEYDDFVHVGDTVKCKDELPAQEAWRRKDEIISKMLEKL